MFHLSSSRLFLKLAALCLLVTCLVYFTNRASSTRRGAATVQLLTVQVEPQPESPLQITATKVLSSDPFGPQIEFKVTNTGGKGIRAYTVSRELVTDGGSQTAATLMTLTTQRKILQPRQSTSAVVNEPSSSDPIQTITLSVDFVEFVNGETWGNDTYNSADRLAGQRAGGRAAYEHFRRLLTQKGFPAMSEAVASEGEDVAPPQQNSPEWRDGFRRGFGLVRVRLDKAKKEGGLKKVELELQGSYDTSEGRPE